MTIIKQLSEKISDEIEDASEYAKLALKFKDKDRSASDTFYSLAQDEMRHSMMLHAEVTKLIEEYRKTNGEPPEKMQAVYDYLHEREIEAAEKVKRYLAMYKE